MDISDGARTVVVLWTAHRAGPWVCRSLTAAGWRVVPAHPVDEGRGRSTAAWSPRRVPSGDGRSGADARGARALCREVGARAILPVDEDCVRLLVAGAADLGGARAVVPTPGQWSALCDKARLGATATRGGCRPSRHRPRHGGPRRGSAPGPALDREGPRQGRARPRARLVVRVETAVERDAAVELLLGEGLEAVVQELVSGTHHTVHCVLAEDAFHAMTGRILRSHPRDAGMPSILEADGGRGPAADAAHRLLASVGYRGPANVQLFCRDGEMLVHDVNLRPPAPVALSMRCGLDLPALGLAAGLGLPIGPPAPVRGGWRYLSLVDELRALRHAEAAPPGSPGRGRIARDLLAGALSRRVILDPPLRDPLWVVPLLRARAPERARRAVRAARRLRTR